MPKIDSHFRSDVGQKRTNNEDFAGAFEPKDSRQLRRSGSLYIVADGLGGHQFGEKASTYAVETLLKVYYEAPDIPPEKRLRDIIQQINQGLIAYAQKNVPMGEKVATTIVAAVVRNGTLQIAHVGDSRAYMIRDGEIHQITKDHSFVGELMRAGSITEAEAQQSPYRNRLMRSLGGKEGNVEVDVTSPISLIPGDILLMCTDGLTQYASSKDILEATKDGSAQSIVERLIKYANAKGGSDNITVSVVKYGKKSALSSLPMLRSWKTLAAVGLGALLLGLFSFMAFRFISGSGAKVATPTVTFIPTPTQTLEPTITPSVEPNPATVLPPDGTSLPNGVVPPVDVTPIGLVDCGYAVRQGDTTGGIRMLFNVETAQIFRGETNLADDDVIFAGEVLTIKGISAEACTAGGGILPTATPMPAKSPPVIESIDMTPTIVCDGRKYSIRIHFHDPDGDAIRMYWELISSKQNAMTVFPVKDISIDPLVQISGADIKDTFEWVAPGDEVQMRVVIRDQSGLSGSLDFGFVCSQ